MRTHLFLPVVAALFAAFLLPADVSAQFVKNTNQSRKLRSVLVGGSGNLIQSNAIAAFIGGGAGNVASREYVTLAGGLSNSSTGTRAAIGGGEKNTASSAWSTVAGGSGNSATASYAAVLGGRDNLASGAGAVALGIEAKATNEGSFVWGNYNTPTNTVSTNDFSWTVQAHGGVRFITTLVDSATVTNGAYAGVGLTNGVYLAPNSGAWASLSDSNAKTKVTPINKREILFKVASMPVTQWEYKVDPDRRYIGPMAQDFRAAFGLGSDNKTISTLDSDGVMYAAIQGLVEELKLRDKEIEELKIKSAQVDVLKKQLEAFEARLDALPPAP